MTIQRENREQQAEILNFIARLFEMHDPETGRMVQVIHSPERLDALKAGAAALSRQREQDGDWGIPGLSKETYSRSAHPSVISDGDQRGDDSAGIAALNRIADASVAMDNYIRYGPPASRERWRELTHEFAEAVRDEMRINAVQPSAALSQPSRQLESDDGAGLIHQAIPDVVGTEPRPNYKEACEQIVSLSAGWDAAGAIGPKPPLSWESVARLALDLARYAVRQS